MTTKGEYLQVCRTCFMFIELGELPSEEDGLQAVQDGAKRLRAGGYNYTGLDTTFSWSTCDCCGSQLGGTRFEYRN